MKKICEFDFKFDLDFYQEFIGSTRLLACTSLWFKRFHNKGVKNLGQNPKALV